MTIPALTLPPVVPNRWSDAPDVFVNNTQAFLDWMSIHGNELGPWATSVAATFSGTDFNATSTTSLTVGTGSKTLTVQAGKLYQIGQFVIIAYTTTPANFMYGQVTAYNSVTGSLTVNVSAIGGSGTQTAWSVGLAPNTAAYMPIAGGTFTDKVTTATPAAGQEALIIPHGAAPTAPANGSIWSTAVAFFTQINGVAQTQMTLAGGTLTGLIATIASAIGGAGLRVPHGAAPTSPVNGDIWSTTAAFFARINGVTRQLATLNAAETLTSKTLGDPVVTGSLTNTPAAITDAAAFVINPRNGAIQTITLGANRTPTKAGWVTGDSMRLMVTGAGFTLDFTTVAVTWIGGVAPTLESSGYTVIELWQVGATIYGTTHEIPAVAAATLPGINYVGGVTATGTLVANPSTPSVSLTGLTGGLGSAPIAGDVVVVVLSAGLNADQVLTMTTAGFTKEKDSYVAGTNPCNFGIWYKVMTGTPDTSIALSIPRPSIGTYSIAIQVFRGVDPTTQIDATTTTAALTTSILANPPSNTPVTSLNLLLAIGGGAHSLGSAPTFGAAAMTNFITAGQANDGGSFGSTVGMGYLRNVAAANDPAAFTFSTSDNTAYCSLGVTMILRAA
jgi:hypothetical protein